MSGRKSILTYDGLFKFVEKNKHFNQPDVVEVETDYEVLGKARHADLIIRVLNRERFNEIHRFFSYFKELNVIEFKSPADRFEYPRDVLISVMLYSALVLSGEVDFNGITYTVITAHKPRKYFSHIDEGAIVELERGVYAIREGSCVELRVVVLNELEYKGDEDRFVLKMFSGNRAELVNILKHLLESGRSDVVEKYSDELYLLVGDEVKKIFREESEMTVIEKNLYKFAKEKGWIEWLAEGFKKGLERGLKEGVRKGLEEGVKKGLEEGMRKAMERVVERMLLLGKSIEEISELTGIEPSEIREIKKRLNSENQR